MTRQFPNSIRAGLSLRVTVAASDYPAPAWTAKALITGPSSIVLSATGDETCHSFAETGARTAGFAPGWYAYSIRATDGSDVFEIESGRLEVIADVSASDPTTDHRDHAQRVLAAIEAVIEGRANKDQQSYTINGRTLVRTPIGELTQLRKEYKAEVAKTNADGRKRMFRRQVKVVW